MIFKRPKTLNDFFLYEKEWFLKSAQYGNTDIENKTDAYLNRNKEIWKDTWEEFFNNSLNFWTFIVISERFAGKNKKAIEFKLSDFGNPMENPRLFEYFDKRIYDEISWHDYNFENGASFQFTVFRIAELSWLFLAFDIKSISYSYYIDEIKTDIFNRAIRKARKSDDYWTEYDKDLLLYQLHYLDLDYATHEIYGKWEWYNIIPDSDDLNYDFQAIIGLLWDFLDIEIELDDTNMAMLHKYVYDKASFDCSFNYDLYIAKLIHLVPECEVIGNLLRIPAEIILEADFLLIRFLWVLSLDDSVYVFDWKIGKYLDVSVSTILPLLKAMWIDLDEQKQAKSTKTLKYDDTSSSLFYEWKKIVFTELNNKFITEFFDLLTNRSNQIEFDTLAERMDDKFESLPFEKQRILIRSIYDRVKACNQTIKDKSGINAFFSIKQRKVLLSEPDILK
jgi:hypothetical protein